MESDFKLKTIERKLILQNILKIPLSHLGIMLVKYVDDYSSLKAASATAIGSFYK